MRFNELLYTLRLASIKDIAKKLDVYSAKPDKKDLIKKIIPKVTIEKKKWYKNIVFGLSFTLILTFIGWAISYCLSEQSALDQERRHYQITENLKRQAVSQKLLGELVLGKFDLLKEYFPEGYVVVTQLSNGENIYIEYPGKWIMDANSILLERINGNWLLSYNADESFNNEGRNITIKQLSMNRFPIDMDHYLKLQYMHALHYGNKTPCLLLLKNDRDEPKFAFGLTDYDPEYDRLRQMSD